MTLKHLGFTLPILLAIAGCEGSDGPQAFPKKGATAPAGEVKAEPADSATDQASGGGRRRGAAKKPATKVGAVAEP